jgi:proton glutamate symport protein
MNKTLSNLIYFSIIAFIGFLLYLPNKLPGTNEGIIAIRIALLGVLLYLTIKRKKLSVWIFFAMILGVEVGIDFTNIGTIYNGVKATTVPVSVLYPAGIKMEPKVLIDFHQLAIDFERFGIIFLRLIKTLVAPLIFATLVVGIAGHSSLKQVGRMGIKSIIYFEVVTTFALFIGLAAINISQAGVKVEATEVELKKSASYLEQTKTHKDHIVDIFPENIAKSIHENQVLQIVVFSIIFAIGLSLVKNVVHKETMLRFCESLSEVMFKFTDIVMYAAPFAVFGALASTVARSGLDILVHLLQLVGTLYVALVVFILVVLLPIALIARINIRRFIKQVTEPVTLAFATASSEAALPKALENMQRFGVPGKIASFVIPTGYSFNLDGTTLYLSLASVFVAQMCGADLTIGQQITMCLILMLTSKGVAGVRGASFVILATTVASLGLDPGKASIILAVDALMDMARTSVNVLGNCLATAVIARSEGELSNESQFVES